MRCKACDVALTDNESTKKDEVTGEYYDTCLDCLYSGDDYDPDEFWQGLSSVVARKEDCDE